MSSSTAATSPLEKIIFIQRIAKFASSTPRKIIRFSYVNLTWKETILEYSFFLLLRPFVFNAAELAHLSTKTKNDDGRTPILPHDFRSFKESFNEMLEVPRRSNDPYDYFYFMEQPRTLNNVHWMGPHAENHPLNCFIHRGKTPTWKKVRRMFSFAIRNCHSSELMHCFFQFFDQITKELLEQSSFVAAQPSPVWFFFVKFQWWDHLLNAAENKNNSEAYFDLSNLVFSRRLKRNVDIRVDSKAFEEIGDDLETGTTAVVAAATRARNLHLVRYLCELTVFPHELLFGAFTAPIPPFEQDANKYEIAGKQKVKIIKFLIMKWKGKMETGDGKKLVSNSNNSNPARSARSPAAVASGKNICTARNNEDFHYIRHLLRDNMSKLPKTLLDKAWLFAIRTDDIELVKFFVEEEEIFDPRRQVLPKPSASHLATTGFSIAVEFCSYKVCKYFLEYAHTTLREKANKKLSVPKSQQQAIHNDDPLFYNRNRDPRDFPGCYSRHGSYYIHNFSSFDPPLHLLINKTRVLVKTRKGNNIIADSRRSEIIKLLLDYAKLDEEYNEKNFGLKQWIQNWKVDYRRECEKLGAARTNASDLRSQLPLHQRGGVPCFTLFGVATVEDFLGLKDFEGVPALHRACEQLMSIDWNVIKLLVESGAKNEELNGNMSRRMRKVGQDCALAAALDVFRAKYKHQEEKQAKMEFARFTEYVFNKIY